MKNIFKRAVLALLLAVIIPGASYAGDAPYIKEAVTAVKDDFKNFYLDTGNILYIGGAITAGGIIANTDSDREFQEYYRGSLRSNITDSVADVATLPGEVLLTLPLLLTARLASPDTACGKWAGGSLRALFVGAPLGLFLQYATGGSRPSEGPSHWEPFNGNNGLSGHAFIGAVPFLTAAGMTDDSYTKGLLYGLSALTGLSRINDDKHYISQAFLGWFLAWRSVSAVSKGVEEKRISIEASPYGDGAIVVLNASF